MLSLSNYNLLDKLGEVAGFTTRRLALRAGRTCDRRGSAMVRQDLLYLQSEGYVRPMDTEKPVVWVRTPKGTTELERAIAAFQFQPYRE